MRNKKTILVLGAFWTIVGMMLPSFAICAPVEPSPGESLVQVFFLTENPIASDSIAFKNIADVVNQKLSNPFTAARFIMSNEADARQLLSMAGGEINKLKKSDLVLFGRQKEMAFLMVIETWKQEERQMPREGTYFSGNSQEWIVDVGMTVRVVNVETGQYSHFQSYSARARDKNAEVAVRTALTKNLERFSTDRIEVK